MVSLPSIVPFWVQKYATILMSDIDSVDYKTFLSILNRPDGFKPAGTPGVLFKLYL
jgi:hypothetical protein